MVVNRMKVNELKKELKGLSTAELVEKENELKQELFNLRFQMCIRDSSRCWFSSCYRKIIFLKIDFQDYPILDSLFLLIFLI